MIVTTGNDVAGRVITEYLGIARGTFTASLLEPYDDCVEKTQAYALDLMTEHAESLGADAVIGMRFEDNWVYVGLLVICYGTAVKLNHP
jgi:uncharacterized protein YbjQ (UPF0145 family)